MTDKEKIKLLAKALLELSEKVCILNSYDGEDSFLEGYYLEDSLDIKRILEDD